MPRFPASGGYRRAMSRVLLILPALGTAAIVAMFIDSVAHDNLGLGFDAIRFGALNTAAAIFALLARGSALRGKK
jgi:hypothetical protein